MQGSRTHLAVSLLRFIFSNYYACLKEEKKLQPADIYKHYSLSKHKHGFSVG